MSNQKKKYGKFVSAQVSEQMKNDFIAKACSIEKSPSEMTRVFIEAFIEDRLRILPKQEPIDFLYLSGE